MHVQPTLPFELGYGLELVGVSPRVSLNPKERDRKFLFHFTCHVLRRQREGKGHGVIVPCAISKVAQPVKSSLGADKFKLRIGLNMINHDAGRKNSIPWWDKKPIARRASSIFAMRSTDCEIVSRLR